MDKIPTVEDVREQRIAFVAEHWGRMSIEEICERLGKSRKAVYSMVERYRDRIPRLRMRVNDEELDYIAEHSDMTSLHIGKALGRSHHTVRKYRSVLRDAGRLAYERTPWTPDDDAIVMSLPPAESMKKLNRTAAAVHARRGRLKKRQQRNAQ